MPQTSSSLSTADLRRHIDTLPRFPLGHLPTPFERLTRFSKALGGPTIHIKRDDCTGLAFGGNKTRHNEFLMAAALAQGADLFVWGAGVQSNNCRQTAAACARAGLDCQLILGRGQGKTGDEVVQGNLLLDHLVGADYQIVDALIGEELDNIIEETANRHRANGRNVYSWNRETVKPLAAVSYALCVAEIAEQSQSAGVKPSAIYVSSAGSTGSGTQLGVTALGLDCPVYNICPIEWEWDTQADMAHLATEAAKLIGLDLEFQRPDINVTFDYIGPAYGKVSEGGLEALTLLARTEGLGSKEVLHFGFGHGPRVCPGKHLGQLEVGLVVGAFVKLFRFKAINVVNEARAGVSTKPADGTLIDITSRRSPLYDKPESTADAVAT